MRERERETERERERECVCVCVRVCVRAACPREFVRVCAHVRVLTVRAEQEEAQQGDYAGNASVGQEQVGAGTRVCVFAHVQACARACFQRMPCHQLASSLQV